MTTLKAIDKNIATLSTNIDGVNKLAHETGVMILEHAKEHRDCTRALVLVSRMPRSFRKEMLVEWFHKYSPVRVIEKNNKVGILQQKDKRFVDWDIEGATANPFFTMEGSEGSKRAPLNEVQVLELVSKLAETITKKIENGKIEEGATDTAEALVHVLQALDLPALLVAQTGAPKVETNVRKLESADDAAVKGTFNSLKDLGALKDVVAAAA